MKIYEKSKDFNPEIYSNFSMISEIEKNQLFVQNFFSNEVLVSLIFEKSYYFRRILPQSPYNLAI